MCCGGAEGVVGCVEAHRVDLLAMAALLVVSDVHLRLQIMIKGNQFMVMPLASDNVRRNPAALCKSPFALGFVFAVNQNRCGLQRLLYCKHVWTSHALISSGSHVDYCIRTTMPLSLLPLCRMH
jgi:hypothetical protein